MADCEQLDANGQVVWAVVDVARVIDVVGEGKGDALAQIDVDGGGLGVVLQPHVPSPLLLRYIYTRSGRPGSNETLMNTTILWHDRDTQGAERCTLSSLQSG